MFLALLGVIAIALVASFAPMGADKIVHAQTFLAGNVESLRDYQSSVAGRFEDYLANRNFFYGVEQRWSASPFWSRRQQRTAL